MIDTALNFVVGKWYICRTTDTSPYSHPATPFICEAVLPSGWAVMAERPRSNAKVEYWSSRWIIEEVGDSAATLITPPQEEPQLIVNSRPLTDFNNTTGETSSSQITTTTNTPLEESWDNWDPPSMELVSGLQDDLAELHEKVMSYEEALEAQEHLKIQSEMQATKIDLLSNQVEDLFLWPAFQTES